MFRFNVRTTSTVVFSLLFFGIAFLFSAWVLRDPYHADTSQALLTYYHLRAGDDFQIYLQNRPLFVYILTGFSFLFTGYALKVLTILSFGCLLSLLAVWYLRLSDDSLLSATGDSRPVSAAAVLLFATLPATLISASIGKEDILSAALVVASLLLTQAGGWRVLFAGLLFGAAVTVKETALLALPVVAGMVYMQLAPEKGDISEWFSKGVSGKAAGQRLGIFFGGFLLVLLVMLPAGFSLLASGDRVPGEEYMPIFAVAKGEGLTFWMRGLGILFFFLQFAVLYYPFTCTSPKARFVAWLLALETVLFTIVLLSGRAHFRMYLWPALFAALPALLVLGDLLKHILPSWNAARIVIYGAACLSVLFSLYLAAPALAFRAEYNPVAGYFSMLPGTAEKNLYIATDSAPHVEYYTGIKTLERKKFPSEANSRELLTFIDDTFATGKVVMMTTDAFAYDKDATFRKVIKEKYVTVPMPSSWMEDYHALDLGRTVESYEALLRERAVGCAVSSTRSVVGGQSPLPDNAVLEVMVQCGKRRHRIQVPLVESLLGDRVMPNVRETPALRLSVKGGGLGAVPKTGKQNGNVTDLLTGKGAEGVIIQPKQD